MVKVELMYFIFHFLKSFSPILIAQGFYNTSTKFERPQL